MVAIDNFCRVITSFPLVSGIIALVLLFLPCHLPAQDLPVSRLTTLRSDWAFADFNGDKSPDLALTEFAAHSLNRIDLHLSDGSESHFTIRISEPMGLTLRAQDVDGDHDLDLVITAGILHRPVGVWLNDGAGNFTQADSSLYPAAVWRGPPGMFARTTLAETAKALAQVGRFAESCQTAEPDPFGIYSTVQAHLPCAPALPIPAGQGRVRPPPAV